MHVMTQSLKGGNGPHFPNGLSVVNTYTKVISGSKQVLMVVKILMAPLITIAKGVKVAQVVAANVVLLVKVTPDTLKKLDEIQDIQWTKMMVELMKKLLFQQLDLYWPAQALLAEYHNIFSPTSGELGCMYSTWDQGCWQWPFKESFWRISPPMVDAVHAHVNKMSEAGAIHPSQSPWCNAVVLVCKKGGGLCSTLTFVSSMPEPRKTPIHFPKYGKIWKAWL